VVYNDVALGELLVSRGRYAEAVDALRGAGSSDAPGIGTLALPTMVEAAVRAGDQDLARSSLDRLQVRVRVAGTPRGQGLLGRCGALPAPPDRVESLHREALERLTEAQMPLNLARAQLLYGEWLRRERRRIDAIEQLGAASAAFQHMDAAAYAERARIELSAAGGRVRRRPPETRDELTAQERQVAAGAASGATNRAIASTMFLSEATVAYHLRKVYSEARDHVSPPNCATSTWGSRAPVGS
jgi:DNA-binding CsgD family transcriptional regulator